MVKEISIEEMLDYFKNKGAIVEKYEHAKKYNILISKTDYIINLDNFGNKCFEINIESKSRDDIRYIIRLFTNKGLYFKIPLSEYIVSDYFILKLENINPLHIDNNGDICIG